jgi:integrase
MASIAQLKNGLKRIDFYDASGDRKRIRIGKVSMDDAKKIKTKIEELIVAEITGTTLGIEVAKWLAERSHLFYQKLVKVGLAQQRANGPEPKGVLLEPFIDEQVSRRKAKPATKEIWRQGKIGLIRFFGPETPLAEVTPGMADDYKEFLQNMPTTTNPEKKLAPMTVRKRLQFAKMVFRAALRHRYIAANPFEDVGIKAAKTAGRERFITADETKLLLEACGDKQDWRTIIALSSWGGLRCPSEVLSLKISAIDWEKNRITVTSPKTEHHDGGGSREIPLFPELHDEILRACEAAPDGAVYLVNECYRKAAMGPSGWRNVNLRTTFKKIIKQAGLTPWPRLFHNLRSSRQTELEERFPTHVVCAWLGNSPDIAREHYLQMRDTYWGQATGDPLERKDDVTKAQRPAQRQNAISRDTASHGATMNRAKPEENDNPRESQISQRIGRDSILMANPRRKQPPRENLCKISAVTLATPSCGGSSPRGLVCQKRFATRCSP